MRASRQTELLKHFPIKDVCEWLGNSPKIALEHYAQVTTESLGVASKTLTGPAPNYSTNYSPEAEIEVKAKQNPKQNRAEQRGLASNFVSKLQHFLGFAHEKALISHVLQNQGMGGEGLEPATSTLKAK